MKTMTMKSIKQYKFSLLHIFIICLSIPGMLGVVSVLSGCEDENTGDFVKGDTGYSDLFSIWTYCHSDTFGGDSNSGTESGELVHVSL